MANKWIRYDWGYGVFIPTGDIKIEDNITYYQHNAGDRLEWIAESELEMLKELDDDDHIAEFVEYNFNSTKYEELLTCFKCDKKLNNYQQLPVVHPNNGLHFKGYGAYGSTVFDPMNGTSLDLVICDECLKSHRHKLYGDGVMFMAEDEYNGH